MLDRSINACCPDWIAGMKILDHYTLMDSMHSWGNPDGYTGPKFLFCPWCGKGIKQKGDIMKPNTDFIEGILSSIKDRIEKAKPNKIQSVEEIESIVNGLEAELDSGVDVSDDTDS